MACFRRTFDKGCDDRKLQWGQVTVEVDLPLISFLA